MSELPTPTLPNPTPDNNGDSNGSTITIDPNINTVAMEICGINGCQVAKSPGQAIAMHKFRAHGVRKADNGTQAPPAPAQTVTKPPKTAKAAKPARKQRKRNQAPKPTLPTASTIIAAALGQIYPTRMPPADHELALDWVLATRKFIEQANRA